MKSLEEIELEFKNQIKIPATKPKRHFFFCPTGLIGSGKTTITKLVSDKYNLVRISNDELRLILKDNGYGFDSLKDIILKIAREFVLDGYSLAFDMNCANPVTKEQIDIFSKNLNIPTIWIHINPPEEFILNSIRSRRNIKIFDNADHAIENYFNQKKELEQDIDKIDYTYVIDPSKNNIEAQMKELYLLIDSVIY